MNDLGFSQIPDGPGTTIRETHPEGCFPNMELIFVFILDFRNLIAATVPRSRRDGNVPPVAGMISAVRTSPDNLFSLFA